MSAPLELPSLALTLIQPWGTAIMLRVPRRKDIENRTWAPGARLRVGDRLWIHAGKTFDEDASGDAAYVLADDKKRWATWVDELDRAPRGALLGHVRFDGVVRTSTSPWFCGPVGWRLADPVVLPTPIPCRGAQQLWVVPSDVLEQAREQLAGGRS